MNRTKDRAAFTLVELLVVIGIIAVLIGILLPALNKARDQAKTVACLANMKSLGQAMVLYVSQNKGWIPGSGNTSGRHLWTVSGGNQCLPADPSYNIASFMPGLNEPQDWAAPLLNVMGIKMPGDNDPRGRFLFYLNSPALRCPASTEMLMTPNGGDTSLGAQPMMSYLTATAFLTLPYSAYPYAAANGFTGNVVWLAPQTTGEFPQAPNGYTPKITKVGTASNKIFMADGAKRSYYTSPTVLRGPEYVLANDPISTRNQYTVFSDWGAFYGNSPSYQRVAVPGNATGTVSRDGRVLAYRHGTKKGFQPAGAYKMNAVFYDGHAETLDDFSACEPSLWLPSDTTFWNPTRGSSNSIGGTKVLWTDYQKSKYPGAWGTGTSFTVR